MVLLWKFFHNEEYSWSHRNRSYIGGRLVWNAHQIETVLMREHVVWTPTYQINLWTKVTMYTQNFFTMKEAFHWPFLPQEMVLHSNSWNYTHYRTFLNLITSNTLWRRIFFQICSEQVSCIYPQFLFPVYGNTCFLIRIINVFKVLRKY